MLTRILDVGLLYIHYRNTTATRDKTKNEVFPSEDDTIYWKRREHSFGFEPLTSWERMNHCHWQRFHQNTFHKRNSSFSGITLLCMFAQLCLLILTVLRTNSIDYRLLVSTFLGSYCDFIIMIIQLYSWKPSGIFLNSKCG